ncbi:MAG: HlyC/CorC family transporter [Clostridia bacterium]|nr:HlyC/CorC family transporter [Clostridia bacterium]
MFNDPLPVAIMQVVLLVIMSLCTGAEAAILSVNDYKMKELAKEGNKKAKRVIKLMNKEGRVVSSVQTALMTFAVAISAMGACAYTKYLDKYLDNELLSFVIVVVAHMVIMVVFCDMIPKKICTSKPDKSAMGLSSFISFIWTVFRPVSFLLNCFSKIFVALSGNDPDGENANVTEDEIMMMVDLGSEKGTIAPEEKELITNIFEFGENCADDVMTHRKDVTVLMMDETAEEWEEKVRESGFSRFPVCGDDIDDIKGVVYARELYEFFYDKGEDISEIIHQAYIVPETISADVLFRNMQLEKTHFAIVADEYGGFAGIVTMDDLLGEIVGEIEDEEYDEEVEEEREDLIKIGENEWDMDGLTLLEEISELTGAELPKDEFDTLSGLVLHSIDYIPDDGATLKVVTCGLEINVTDFKDRRVVRATVKLLPKEETEE